MDDVEILHFRFSKLCLVTSGLRRALNQENFARKWLRALGIKVKIIMTIRRWFASGRLGPDKEKEACDPMIHPEIRRMSQRELSDLPFMRPSEMSCMHAQNSKCERV
jgi:hypothetical protein